MRRRSLIAAIKKLFARSTPKVLAWPDECTISPDLQKAIDGPITTRVIWITKSEWIRRPKDERSQAEQTG